MVKPGKLVVTLAVRMLWPLVGCTPQVVHSPPVSSPVAEVDPFPEVGVSPTSEFGSSHSSTGTPVAPWRRRWQTKAIASHA